MPVFHLTIADDITAEMDIECASASEAVSRALVAMSAFVAEKANLPGDITITIQDSVRSSVASITVTFPDRGKRGVPH